MLLEKEKHSLVMLLPDGSFIKFLCVYIKTKASRFFIVIPLDFKFNARILCLCQ